METVDSRDRLSIAVLHVVVLSRRSCDMTKFDIAKVTLDDEDEWDMEYFPRH